MNVFLPSVVGLDQSRRCFLQKAGLLFDQQYPAIRRDDDEVDLPIGGKPALDAGPVHAVEDGVTIGQAVFEQPQGFDFPLRSAGDADFLPAGRLYVSHEKLFL